MDFDDEWELLSDEISDEAGKQIYSRNSSAASVVHVNYFISQPPPQFVETTTNQILHAPDRDQQIQGKIESFSADQHPISQDFFNKLKEAELVDLKVESHKFNAEMAIKDDDDGSAWKRSLSCLCSFGVAAATFCIIVFANKHPHQNHKLDKVRICRSN